MTGEPLGEGAGNVESMESLIGTWRLVEWAYFVDDEVVARPFGGNPTGLLTYTEDGRMWATLMRTKRARLGSRTLAGASQEERATAAAGYINYAGTYEVGGDTVDHHVEVSLFPDWVGGVQRRHIEWIDGDLVLSSPPETTAEDRPAVNRLRWRRVTGGNG